MGESVNGKQVQAEKVNCRFSNKVTVLSFIMSIFVICIHANNLSYYGLETATQSIDYSLVKILAEVTGGVAVPFFFMMSGYWYFRGLNIKSENVWKDFLNKSKKKIWSLVIPYILWNAFGMVFYMVVTRIPILASAMNNGEIVPITLANVISGIFAHKYYFTFWYMQDLIIITFAVVPALILILRSNIATVITMSMLLALSVLGLNLPFVNTSSILLFMCGGVLVTYVREWTEKRKSKRVVVAFCIVLIVCCVARFFDLPVISDICLYVSPFLLLNVADSVEIKKVTWFPKQSFFIYAVHVIPVTIIGHLLAMISDNPLWAAGAYLLAVAITVCLIYVVGKLLSRILPGFYRLICGGR